MKKAFTIGIAGGSAGGKSTFAEKLKTALGEFDVCVLSMDSYFKLPEERVVANAPITKKTLSR